MVPSVAANLGRYRYLLRGFDLSHNVKKSFDEARILALPEAVYMRRGVNLGIADLYHLNLRMRYEFDIGDHADTDSPGDSQPHCLPAANLHDRCHGYLRILQGAFECEPRGRSFFTKHHALSLEFGDLD